MLLTAISTRGASPRSTAGSAAGGGLGGRTGVRVRLGAGGAGGEGGGTVRDSLGELLNPPPRERGGRERWGGGGGSARRVRIGPQEGKIKKVKSSGNLRLI